MPSLVVDTLLCVLLVAGAYILFGREPVSKSTNKKKKRSKASKKAARSQIESTDDVEKPSAVATAKIAGPPAAGKQSSNQTQNKQNLKRPKGVDAQKTSQPSNIAKASPTYQDSEDDDDFPELTSSYAAKVSKGVDSKDNVRKPLAERRAKALPETAVDDMVEKDDALQGQKIYSRTMRIVKPEADKPLLLDEQDEHDDGSEQEDSEARRQESAWQSVPLSSKSKSIKIP
ncbi:hypothetical protein P389DRAFT_90365 [Cystobasidium minutum MCA 4210]|uniref:uncharacterized protein n=1 Tax=Cystobasidium minutum MCA 4210 TaxID=1397322 RepID=UPI0034CF36BA|eukprot:jgi/Rhomi1/90365/CE90364_1596